MESRAVIWAKVNRPGNIAGLSFLAVGLLLGSMYVLSAGLAEVSRGVELALLSSMGLLGALTGLALAAMRIPSGLAVGLGALIGFAVVLIRAGAIGQQVLNLLWVVGLRTGAPGYLWEWGWALVDRNEAIHRAWTELGAALLVLYSRTQDWLVHWISGEPRFDPVAAALLWSAVLWLVSAWAGWVLMAKGQPLAALIPPGVTLGLALGLVGAKPAALLWSLGLALLLMVVVAQDRRELSWRRSAVSFGQGLRRNLLLWGSLLAVALVTAGALSQVISIRNLVRFVEQVTAQRGPGDALVQEALGLERQESPARSAHAELERLRAPGLPRIHLLGSGPELAERLVLVVRLNDQQGRGFLREATGPIFDFYWQSTSYDFYTGRGWRTGLTERAEYEADEMLADRIPENHQLVEQTVRAVPELSGLVFAAGSLMSVDAPYYVDWRSGQDAFGAALLEPAARSRVRSAVPEAGEDELRRAGTEYPEWVEARYLQLPDGLPDRVIALARNLTATAPTPYDRALAMERYLRSFVYTLDVTSPPTGRDVVDYFLFDLQRGYCDYFASSMVVLARAAGLPARLQIGYVTGTYDPELGAYLVSEADAHSWPAIFFPGYGWVKFEPTSGRPELVRSEQSSTIEPGELELSQAPKPADESLRLIDRLATLDRLLRVIGFVAAIGLVTVGSSVVAFRSWRVRQRSVATVALDAYRKLSADVVRLGIRVPPGATPNELASSLGARLPELATNGPAANLLRNASGDVATLIETYVRVIYAPGPPDGNLRAEIQSTIRRLRWSLWVGRMASWRG